MIADILPPPGPPDAGLIADLAGRWLYEIRADPARGLLGLQLTVAGNPPGDSMWRDLALKLSENNDPAVPYPDPDAARWCDYCGHSDASELEPGPDGPERPERVCRDTDACVARRQDRYPPDDRRCPSWALELAYREREAQDYGQVIRAAASRAAEDYIAYLTAQPDEPVMLTAAEAPAAAWGSQAQAPAAYDPWGHTMRSRRHRAHLVSGGHTWPGQVYAPGESQGIGPDTPMGAGVPGSEEHGLQWQQGPGAPMDHPAPAPSPRRRRAGRYGGRRRSR
jgi:hypothetical protein